MATSKQALPDSVAAEEIYIEDADSETQSFDCDDSDEDPSFDFVEQTRSKFSNLSVKKSKSRRIYKENDHLADAEMMETPVDEKDSKSFEKVQKTIDAGLLETLKVEQCKVYLRKHGLRLSGTKDVLIQRIKEHAKLIKEGGEGRYPVSSFVLNCKGDACTGDIVMFEQNVYEMYSIASRSATGPPCGKRVVVGRIVKESYGSAKQQHTFTIEVLWSKGEKPLPPLQPLLIKGRNLYRLKTLRQKWENEGERQKVLNEKHSRGSHARSNRESRIQEKEMRKMHKLAPTRAPRVEGHNRDHSQPNTKDLGSTFGSGKMGTQPLQQQNRIRQSSQESQKKRAANIAGSPSFPNLVEQQTCSIYKENIRISSSIVNTEKWQIAVQEVHDRGNIYCSNDSRGSKTNITEKWNSSSQIFRGLLDEYSRDDRRPNFYQNYQFSPPRSPFKGPGGGLENRQLCRYYVQGRCKFGESCKYLHGQEEGKFDHHYEERRKVWRSSSVSYY